MMNNHPKPPRINGRRYRGQWVALHPRTRKVIAHDVSLKAARQAAVKHGVTRPILYAVPKSDGYFVG